MRNKRILILEEDVVIRTIQKDVRLPILKRDFKRHFSVKPGRITIEITQGDQFEVREYIHDYGFYKGKTAFLVCKREFIKVFKKEIPWSKVNIRIENVNRKD